MGKAIYPLSLELVVLAQKGAGSLMLTRVFNSENMSVHETYLLRPPKLRTMH